MIDACIFIIEKQKIKCRGLTWEKVKASVMSHILRNQLRFELKKTALKLITTMYRNAHGIAMDICTLQFQL